MLTITIKCLFLIIGNCLLTTIECCENRSVLHKIDAWVRAEIDASTDKIESIDFHLLDHYKVIDVTKATIPILCEGMIRKFPVLEKLTLISVNLSDIEDGAFSDMPHLMHLSLAANRLTTITRGYFTNLKSLKTLYLSSNFIDNIEANAFDMLLQLERVYLDRNKLGAIEMNWFLKTVHVSFIDFSFNLIRELQMGAFTVRKSTVIWLKHNFIDVIDSNAIKMSYNQEDVIITPDLTLNIDYNRVTDVKKDFLNSFRNINANLLFKSNYIECLSDDVLDLLVDRNNLALNIIQNPLTCRCVHNINQRFKFISESRFYYNSTNTCYIYRE